jgi:hypothetical protein
MFLSFVRHGIPRGSLIKRLFVEYVSLVCTAFAWACMDTDLGIPVLQLCKKLCFLLNMMYSADIVSQLT